MQSIYKALRRLLIILCLVGIVWSVFANYEFVFSKVVKGEVLEVERVSQPTAIIGGSPMTPEQMFSFAVMVKSFNGTIYSASSEDRQWAIARKGYCVEARYYPYPPWNLDKADTYHNARLVRVFECKSEAPATWKPTGAPNAPNALEAAPTAPAAAPGTAPASAPGADAASVSTNK